MKATTDTLHVVRNIKNIKNNKRNLSPAVKSKARLTSVESNVKSRDEKRPLNKQEAVQQAAHRTG